MARSGRRRRPSAVRPSASTTVGTVGPGDDPAHGRDRHWRRVPRPLPTTSAGSGRARRAPSRPSPSPGASVRTTSTGIGRSHRTHRAGRAQPHVARAGPLGAARPASAAAPFMPGLAGDDPHRALPLVGRRTSAVGQPRRARRCASTRWARRRRRRARCRPRRPRRRSARPGEQHEAGLERGERDRRVGAHRAVGRLAGAARRRRTGCRPPARARRPDRGASVLAPEAGAVGGVDHQVARRAASAGASAASMTCDPHAAAPQAPRPRRDRRCRCCPCRRRRRPGGRRCRRACRARARATAAPARPMSTSTGSGAARSIAAISSGVTIGITG